MSVVGSAVSRRALALLRQWKWLERCCEESQASKGKGACLDYYCNDARTTLNTLAQTRPVHTPILCYYYYHHHHHRHALLKAATPTPLPIIPYTTPHPRLTDP